MPQIRGYLLRRLFTLLATQGVLEQPPEQLYQQASAAPPQVIPKALAALIAEGKEERRHTYEARIPSSRATL